MRRVAFAGTPIVLPRITGSFLVFVMGRYLPAGPSGAKGIVHPVGARAGSGGTEHAR